MAVAGEQMFQKYSADYLMKGNLMELFGYCK